jgi:hypothetical protein
MNRGWNLKPRRASADTLFRSGFTDGGGDRVRTSRIRIGTFVLLLPFHDLVRVAEDVIVVDVLSNGRLDLGVGQDYRAEEFAQDQPRGRDLGRFRVLSLTVSRRSTCTKVLRGILGTMESRRTPATDSDCGFLVR